MTGKTKLIGAGAALVLAGVVVASRRSWPPSASDPASSRAATAAPGSAAAVARAPGAPSDPAGASGELGVAPVAARPPKPPRVMPYRPAKFFLYSEDRVARHEADDESQPALRRIFELTRADPRQQSLIRSFWHIHEDGRRVLYAQAFPRVSGPRILDAQKLEELDTEFESSMFGVLQPDQREDLQQELPPPGTPRTPPVQAYIDPRLENPDR
jgi:hypothetical protein